MSLQLVKLRTSKQWNFELIHVFYISVNNCIINPRMGIRRASKPPLSKRPGLCLCLCPARSLLHICRNTKWDFLPSFLELVLPSSHQGSHHWISTSNARLNHQHSTPRLSLYFWCLNDLSKLLTKHRIWKKWDLRYLTAGKIRVQILRATPMS